MSRRIPRRRAQGRLAGPMLAAFVWVAVGLAITGCGVASSNTTFPPVGSTPAPAGTSTDDVRAAVIKALATVGLQAADATMPYRPPEGPLFATAPRTVLQVTLPDDPTHGFVVLYAFGSPEAAAAAAADQAAYVSSAPGKVQFVLDTRFVLRTTGANAIFFAWSPANAPDARTPTIEQALATVGTAVAVPG